MKKEYDFTKSKKNPYTKLLKSQVTMMVDKDTIAYFKTVANETGIAYQVLINIFLRECAQSHKRPSLKWVRTIQKKA